MSPPFTGAPPFGAVAVAAPAAITSTSTLVKEKELEETEEDKKKKRQIMEKIEGAIPKINQVKIIKTKAPDSAALTKRKTVEFLSIASPLNSIVPFCFTTFIGAQLWECRGSQTNIQRNVARSQDRFFFKLEGSAEEDNF